MEARISNVNSVSKMERKIEQFECDSLYTYLSKGVYPSDYGMNKKIRTRIDTNGKLFYVWKNYLISKFSDDLHRYCKVRNDLRTLTRTLRSDYERNLSLNIKHNPKAFWKYINSRLKVHPTIDDLQCPNGSTAHTDKDKAEALNNFFTSVFTQEDLSSIQCLSYNR